MAGRGRKKRTTRTEEADRFEWLLRQLTEREGLTQADAGAKFGVTQGYVSAILGGRHFEITTDIVRAARKTLRLDPDYFFKPGITADVPYQRYRLDEKADDVPRLERELDELRSVVRRLQDSIERDPPSNGPATHVRKIKRRE